MDDLLQYFNPNADIISRRQIWHVRNDWRYTFSTSVKETTNKWTINNEEWHTFTFGYYPFLKNESAAARIANQNDVSGQLFTSNPNYQNCGLAIWNTTSGKLLGLGNYLSEHTNYYDLYFLDSDRTWTAVFTHEPEFRLIFAERS